MPGGALALPSPLVRISIHAFDHEGTGSDGAKAIGMHRQPWDFALKVAVKVKQEEINVFVQAYAKSLAGMLARAVVALAQDRRNAHDRDWSDRRESIGNE
jgi:hypothetical protein